MLIWLRRIASCFCCTLAILSAALWVRSYFYCDQLFEDRVVWRNGKLESRGATAIVTSLNGALISYIELESLGKHTGWHIRSSSVNSTAQPKQNWSSFDWRPVHRAGVRDRRQARSLQRIVFPHWSVVSVLSLLAIAIRPEPRFKFGLRDLFALTTIAALTIGPLTYWLRLIG